MEDIHSEFIKASNVLTRYTEKFKKRFSALHDEMFQFIKGVDEESLLLDDMLLSYALLDYFEDIERLKLYHHLEHINAIKIASHLAFWLIKRKPIQVKRPNIRYIDINERFVLMYLLDFLSDEDDLLLDREFSGIKSFSETLFFTLKYRLLSPDILELAIISFFAGRIYQSKDKDLSSILGKME